MVNTAVRLIFLAQLFAGLTLSCFGQGLLLFQNFGPSVDAPVFDGAGNRLSGDSYLAILYVGSTADSLQPVLNAATSIVAVQPFLTGAASGYIFPATVRAENVTGGSLVWVEMRVWDARLGATFDEVEQLGLGGYGKSTLFQTLSGGTHLPQPRPLIGLQSFSLLPEVPEPGTLSLIILSSSLLLFSGRHWRRHW